MAFDNEFLSMMTDTVTVAPYTGTDAFLRKTFGPVQRYRARIVGRGVALRRALNEDSAVIYDVYTDGVPVDEDRRPLEGGSIGIFTIQDKLVLPPDVRWEDQEPEIFSVGRYPDEQGLHHYLIQCGFMYHRQSA
jgi:hypothetical protein